MAELSNDGRDEIIAFMRSRLVGPRGGGDERIEGRPLLQYMMGILFARGSQQSQAEAALSAGVEEPGAQAAGKKEDDGGTDDWLRLSGEALPSAVGVSFVVDAGEELKCTVSGARYEPASAAPQRSKRASEEIWKRVPLAPADGEALVLTEARPSSPVFGGLATLAARWRVLGGKRLVTVTLANDQEQGAALDPALAIFQVQLSCEATLGRFYPYPLPAKATEANAEEDYLYRESVPYARGHGVAVGWKLEAGTCKRIWIDFLPVADVPLATFDLPAESVPIDERVLSVEWLSTCANDSAKLRAVLETLVSAYEGWIEKERASAAAAGEPVASNLADRARQWAARMRRGVERIAGDPCAARAFAHANEAMGSQMVLVRRLRDVATAGESLANPEPPDTSAFTAAAWRPFQMAFFLGVIDGLCDPSSPDRSLADVIWFPTGGGKTEAYLLVAAFELLRRRLDGSVQEGATAIMSRYTLRMLTAQQFQRTSALFVALETIRRRDPATWGHVPFKLGLWVGGGDSGLTPNTFVQAKEKLDEMRDADGEFRNAFLLTRCPRCAADMFGPDRNRWGVVATENEFRLFCPNAKCPFSDVLPVDLVDDSLYKHPPSMLIGTVDKFANLPWDQRARAFFAGANGDGTPPTLLIQDELHLIAGPLGTLDAGYEGAIEEIIRRCGGPAPKVICSTATIKNATEQVRGLYARRTYVFPAPIRRWDDAFFFRSDVSRTRRYVGVMGQGYTKALMGLVWTAAVLLQAAEECELTGAERDAFWTLVAYHNSRRELGRTMTAARDEIPTRIKVVASDEGLARELRGEGVMQLSAQMSTSLDRAIRNLEAARGGGEPALDLVPCTSIMSVGIDIDRLGLMVVNGQPKLTAEYIQATSRVGRGKVPGLVVTIFSSMKSRDRSHYEDFKGFHENLYKFVEPTSVTPLAPPARQRTLHAALVSVIRHTTEWGENSGAAVAKLDGPEVRAIRQSLIQRAFIIDEDAAPDVEEELDAVINHWSSHQQQNFVYDRGLAGQQFEPLLSVFGSPVAAGLPTMRSLRHVDPEVNVRVLLPSFKANKAKA